MEAYRDQYATLFNNGKKVVLIAVSVDSDSALASWVKDGNFPFTFASDGDGKVGALYGAYSVENKMDNRSLFVIGPDGKIAYKAQPFRQSSEEAYVQLGDIIDKLSPGEGKSP